MMAAAADTQQQTITDNLHLVHKQRCNFSSPPHSQKDSRSFGPTLFPNNTQQLLHRHDIESHQRTKCGLEGRYINDTLDAYCQNKHSRLE